MKRCLHLFNTGFTLVEILLAMLIGVFLTSGILQMGIQSKRIYKTQAALSRIQEDGRFALDFLSKQLRMSGYIGCGSQQAKINNTLTQQNDYLYRFTTPIEGFDARLNAKVDNHGKDNTENSGGTWSPALPVTISYPQQDSDIIVVRKAEGTGFTIASQADASAPLTLPSTVTATQLKNAGFLACAMVVVTNCSSATVFQISAINGATIAHQPGSCTPGNGSNNLDTAYSGGQIYTISTTSYYVALNPSNTPALYMRENNKPRMELLEGVEQMQILYGVDTDTVPDGSPNFYVDASNVTAVQWPKVTSVRVSLVMVSEEDNLTDNPVSYVLDGVSITPNDKRLRKVFSTTIALRNRLA
jgi:type IV pilus assembly protein PilW